MKKWILKAFVQKTISFLPFKNRINEFFQRFVTRGISLTDEYFTDRLEHAKSHFEFYRQFAGSDQFDSALELGTGWYPIIPVSMFLRGAHQIYSVDISSHTNRSNMLLTLNKFADYHQKGLLENYFRYSTTRMQELLQIIEHPSEYSYEKIGTTLKFKFLIGDARKLVFLNDHTINLITSNNTFEHIYPHVLVGILMEFKRVLSSGGIMSHFVDMSDHFAHFDQSISIYNFLKFSDGEWKMIDNSIQPQNRLRMSDYRKMYSDSGIPISLEVVREGNLQELRSVNISGKYKAIPEKVLAISHCYLVSLIN